MKLLVTGGTGYIGSHTCVALMNQGYSLIILDNFSNSKSTVLENLRKLNDNFIFYNIDVTDEKAVEQVFSKHEIDGVIHFAGYKSVEESVVEPIKYYFNNVVSTMVLVKVCKKYNVKKFVYSSSATVYGENKVPFKEEMELLPAKNPYGESKVMSERILMDVAKADPNFSVSILRYFNPVGAHESGLIGENPKGIPNNIMPYISKVAKGELDKLKIYGNDYPTSDGTGVRDYIHVMDLAEGHVAAYKHLSKGVHIYNLGTGRGTSVLELVHAFEKANGMKVPFEIVERRPGDIAVCYADVSKAEKELGWKAKRNLIDMCRDAWRFESSI
jgi:UDP-glucose 4-epimerase